MQTVLRQGEAVIKNGGANLQKNIETVGGRLWLTNQRLIFEAHRFNVQTGTAEIELADVQSMLPCWTKFLNVIPIFPNSLEVVTRQGVAHRFVLFGRHEWAAAIEAQSQSASMA